MTSRRFLAGASGALRGLVLAMILLLVPIAGVRRGVEHLIGNNQELCTYFACLLMAALAGYMLRIQKLDRSMVDLADGINIEQLPKDDDVETDPSANTIAPGPEKLPWWRRVRFTGVISERTVPLGIALFLILYVNCIALCQRMQLGVFDIPDLAPFIANAGLSIELIGLYLIFRSMIRQHASNSGRALVIDMASGVVLSEEMEEESGQSAKVKQSHVPPVSFGFLKSHPICAGWLLLLAGMPLVFQAWFPLLAIPGIFVVMNWLYGKAR